MRPPGYGYDRDILAGLFVILGIFVIGLFSMKITDTPLFRPGTEFTVFLSDATGIFRNSKVKIAGISVGVVKDIKLQDGKAKVTLILDKGYSIERGAYILPRSLGILGDRFLEVVLPKNDLEKESFEKDGAKQIDDSSQKKSKSSFFEPLLRSLLPFASAEEVYQAGEIIPAKPGTASADDVMRKLGDIGDDVKILAKDLRVLVHENKGDVTLAVKAIKKSADHLELILRDLSEKNTRSDMKEVIHGMRKAIDNIKEISEKINKGEGSIGKLVNDPQTADQLVRALNSINEWLEKAKRTEFIIDMNSNYLMGQHEAKSYFGLKILPRSSYGYIFGIVQDPGGKETKTITTTVIDDNKPVVKEETKIEKSAYKLNFQFLRKIYATTFRLGLFESTGGLGIDQELWRDHLTLSAEAFDFGRDNDNAHVRLFARLQFLETFYIQAGADDLATRSRKRLNDTFFVGLGLRFNDNDLKSLLVLLGAP